MPRQLNVNVKATEGSVLVVKITQAANAFSQSQTHFGYTNISSNISRFSVRTASVTL